MKKDIIPVFFIIIIILFGYHELFSGSNFFVAEDSYIAFNYSHGNAMGNGWRPDKGFGISYFFGDPGFFHAWSIYTLWERIVPSPLFAFNSSVVFLLILAAISQYFFLKRIAPTLGNVVCFVAPLIVFGPLQHEFFFQKHWITLSIGTPLLLILLHDYYKNPKVRHLFLAAVLFWFVLFFGSFVAFLQLLIVGILFCGIYYIYFKCSWKKLLYKITLVYSFGVLWAIILGFWVFYSIFIEQRLVGYIREPVYGMQWSLINIKLIFYFFVNLFHSGWLPGNTLLAGCQWLPIKSWNNSSVVFPFIFVWFLFRHTTNFWEFTLKWLLIVLLGNEILIDTVPAYSSLFQFIINGHPLSSFHPSYHCLQIGLMAIFFSKRYEENSLLGQYWARKIQVGAALLMVLFYGLLGLLCIFAFLIPETLPSMVGWITKHLFPQNIVGYSKELLAELLTFNIRRMEEGMHWFSLTFYLSSAILILPFSKKKWLVAFTSKPFFFLAGLILINGILLSWTVYPLNKKELVWERREMSAILPAFKPTDRFYFVADGTQRTQKTLDSFRKNWVEVEGEGPWEYKVGYWHSYGLNLSGLKSFCQKDVANFTFQIFNGDGKKTIKSMRDLVDGGPFVSSELLNMGAVSYYYSRREIPNIPEDIVLCFKTKQLYIYKNLSSWPYFYLANKLEIKEEGKHLENIQRDTAYVSRKDFFLLPEDMGSSNVKLKEFSYEKMVFDYNGNGENFLVIADAWHPFWKARIAGKDIPVVKANEIFKGVKLPPGKFDLTLYFDTSPYYPGIYISIFAWITFISGWFFVWKYNWNLSFFSSNTKT